MQKFSITKTSQMVNYFAPFFLVKAIFHISYLKIVFLIELTCKGVQPIRQKRPDPTQPAGLSRFLRLGGLGWVTKFFLIAGRVGLGS